MKLKWVALLIFSTMASAAELVPGKHYDFFQKNGQNILGCELLEETGSEYIVRLKYLPKPLRIAKNNLVRQPELSKVQLEMEAARKPLVLEKKFTIHSSFGYSYLTFGSLANIFRNGYEARIGTDWLLFREPFYHIRALSLLTTFSRYQASLRHIQLISAYLGPKFLVWHFQPMGIAIFASPLVGISYTDLKGYTFASSYATFSALAILSIEKRWKQIIFAGQLFANSLFDNSLNFSSTGISVAAYYPFADAEPF